MNKLGRILGAAIMIVLVSGVVSLFLAAVIRIIIRMFGGV